MNEQAVSVIGLFGTAVILLLIIGVYTLMFARTLLRALIGMEVVTQGLMLLFILVGNLSGRMALAQSIVITLIVLEVAVIVIGVGVVSCLYNNDGSMNTELVRRLKG